MTVARAAELYLTNYWQKAGCDGLHPALSLIVFDTAVNMGVGIAIDLLRVVRRYTVKTEEQPFEYTARRINRYASYKLFCTYGIGWVRRSLNAYRVSMEMVG